jgi:hypothetical protein
MVEQLGPQLGAVLGRSSDDAQVRLGAELAAPIGRRSGRQS